MITSSEIPTWLKDLRVPVLHLHGRDPIPYEAVGCDLAAHLSNYQVKTFGSCGHFPWLEPAAREPFLDALVTFTDL